jgi:hypothetical protein
MSIIDAQVVEEPAKAPDRPAGFDFAAASRHRAADTPLPPPTAEPTAPPFPLTRSTSDALTGLQWVSPLAESPLDPGLPTRGAAYSAESAFRLEPDWAPAPEQPRVGRRRAPETPEAQLGDSGRRRRDADTSDGNDLLAQILARES